jgi:Asp-tRNA(Asn)/Glu-tRNA(Gln) amidotransferase A subunit family amidase
MGAYDPKEPGLAPFTSLIPAFLDGQGSPRDYLERCIEAIETREAQVMAFVHLNLEAARQRADAMGEAYAGLAAKADACITLTALGPAPEGMATGDAGFLDPCSIIGAPALSLPLLSSGGLPLGVQFLGFDYQDRRLVAQASWLRDFVLT